MLTVRYWAGARAAAGVPEDVVAGHRPLRMVLDDLAARHGVGLEKALSVCSFLLEGERISATGFDALPEQGVLDILPPFAGG